ncbi:DNA polymerase subunit Cdc27 [Xylaria cf. heliscus]|nr:DNA polymerase subunit Cdc27 [Xylaria cf. heliscus]
MEDYKQYLAQKILTEDQLVTYRLLSRALGVHVNLAKEMLYDFHKWQNDKHPGTLHATYIVYGTKSRPAQADGDVEMTDSQMSDHVDAPFSELVPTYTLSLVGQEQLEGTLSQYDKVASIHVYSLAPHPVKDLQLLTDTARQVLEFGTADNAPKPSKVYGTIVNQNVRRRERRKPAPVAHVPPSKPEPKLSVKQEAKPAVKEEPKASSKPAVASGAAKKPTSATALKRQGSSGIGQMFAKAAAKPKKPAAKASDSAATSAAASGADDNQALSDDGEDDTEPTAKAKEEDNGARQARKDRQAELRRMMEESDEEEEEPEKAAGSPEEDPMDEEPPPPEPEPEPKAEEAAEVVSSTSGGRRRGRRRVTRKKQIMDEKGYLVTIQEQGWESFSEDEAPPPPKAKQPAVKSEPATKSKKGAASKGGQGNIMSFFAKK